MGQSVSQILLSEGNITEQIETLTAEADMIVDSFFGTGLKGQLNDKYIQLIEQINTGNCPVLAVDIPSGLDCDTGQPLGAAIIADYTVTFVAVKKGFKKTIATQYTGEIYVASIGIVVR